MICGTAVNPTSTGKVDDESQPRLLATVTVTRLDPGEFHSTLMLFVLLAPVMVPPVTDQLIVLEVKFCSEYDVVVCVQAEAAPTMTGVGVGLMVMFLVTVESQPDALVAVSVITPVGTAFQFTMMFDPLLVVMLPPVTLHT